MHSDLLLVLVVGTALAFDFTNGFHDTANVVATSISTRALPPRVAIGVGPQELVEQVGRADDVPPGLLEEVEVRAVARHEGL